MTEPLSDRQVVIEAFTAAITTGLIYWYVGRDLTATLLFTALAGATWGVTRSLLRRYRESKL